MKAWDNLFVNLTSERTLKPRVYGLTMVIEKQSGISTTLDLLSVASDFIDHYKIGFGTSVLLKEDILLQKIELMVSKGILVYPGGTLGEIAQRNGCFPAYLNRAHELGFNGIEISDGTINLTRRQRNDAIKRAIDMGFRVITEVGDKDSEVQFVPEEIAEQINSDLELGAENVIVEARESGHGVGVCRNDGTIERDAVTIIVDAVKSYDKILWEAPLKNQQIEFIMRFGLNVNLGNIAPAQVLEVEALRCKLRYDTFKYSV